MVVVVVVVFGVFGFPGVGSRREVTQTLFGGQRMRKRGERQAEIASTAAAAWAGAKSGTKATRMYACCVDVCLCELSRIARMCSHPVRCVLSQTHRRHHRMLYLKHCILYAIAPLCVVRHFEGGGGLWHCGGGGVVGLGFSLVSRFVVVYRCFDASWK